MSRSYGIKKDFSPHKDGELFQQESTVASPPQSMSSYRSTMPAYDVHQHRGRGQHGKLNISSNDTEDGFRSGKGAGSSKTKQSRDKSESAAKEKEKKPRGAGWFGGKKKKRTEKVSDSVINRGKNMARVSPMLSIRSTMRSDDKDQFGRLHATPEEPDDEELRMKLSYDAPIDLSKVSTELIRLSLLPSNASRSTDTLQVTLRKQGHGFGLHLSSGLPPIKVTYIEPGGEAEAAGVKVGDKVLEVNGEDCEKLHDPTKIVALKLMIQQTDIREASGELGIESDNESSGLNDSTWNKIQARQYQEEKESKNSSNVELTQIDGASDTESQTGLDTSSDKTGKNPQQDQVEISPTEWERMREQRELLFDKNAPSSIIQEKSRKKETERSMEPVQSVKSSAVVPEVMRKQEEGGITGGVPLSDKPSPEKVKSGGLFKRKKKTSVPSKQSNGTAGSSGEGGGVTAKKDREKTTGKKHKKAQCEEVVKQDVQSPTGGAAIRKKGKRIGVQVMKVTNIDDVEEEVKKVSDAEMTECIRKTFSYEGQVLAQDSNKQSSSALPRSHSHNTALKVSPLPTLQKQNGGPQSDFPVVSHKRSRSYHGEDEEEGTETKLNVEARTASKSQSNISKLKPETKVEIDSNLRVKKSGVVKGSSSRGRPTLEVFGSAERKAKRKGAERSEQTDSPDGPGLDEYPTDGRVDLGAIPHTNPSLGRDSGHTRRDLVSRSSVKRRPPSKKGSILLQVDESQKMGTKRVELSATHHTDTHTMPEKVSGNLIEVTTPTSSVESATNHKNYTPTKSSETRNIFKELLQRENKSSLKPENRDEGAALIQQPSSDTPSASSAALVAQAVAAKEQMSSEEKMSPQVQGKGELSSLHGVTAGSGLLAQLQDEKRVLKDKEEGRKEEKQAEGEKGTSSFASLSRRRNKTVEKPVKSLGIASDPGTPPHPPQPMVSLRKTPVSESRPAASSSSTTPSWVAMAENKKKRVSAMLEKKASAKMETPLPLQELPSEPASSPTPTSPPVTSFTSPPITSPTSPVTSSTSGVSSFTSTPITSPTSPVTSPTTHPVTSPTSPHVTTPTSPPVTTPTSTPVTTPTSPPVTTTTPPHRRTSEAKMVNSIASDKSEIPRKGHVRDRMALFQ